MDESMLTVGRLVRVNTGKHRNAPAIIEKPETRKGVKGAVVNFSTIIKKGRRVPSIAKIDKPPEWFRAAHLDSRE